MQPQLRGKFNTACKRQRSVSAGKMNLWLVGQPGRLPSILFYIFNIIQMVTISNKKSCDHNFKYIYPPYYINLLT